MFERFTPRARRIVMQAQEEARSFRHDHVGTEHILLALAVDDEGIARKALDEPGVTADVIRAEITSRGLGEHEPAGHIPFTPYAKKVMEGSLREALQLGHGYIGTEHLLLALINDRFQSNVALAILDASDVTPERVRREVIKSLYGKEADDPIGEITRTIQDKLLAQAGRNSRSSVSLPVPDQLAEIRKCLLRIEFRLGRIEEALEIA